MFNFVKKYKILLAVELLCVFFAVLCILLRPAEELVYSEADRLVDVNLGVAECVSEKVELRPGVYQVRIHANVSAGNILYVNVLSDNSAYRSLRCNGASLFANQGYMDFEVYALTSFDDAYIKCEMLGGGQAEIEKLELYRVRYGENILLFWVIAGSLLLNLILFFREGILTGMLGKEQQLVVFALTGGVLLAYFPYLTDYFSSGADTFFHVLRIEGLKESLLQGVRFPIKVQSYWLYDHGYATSAFYGDLFLYIPAILRLIGFTMVTSYRMFIFILLVATAGISYYSFKRCTGHTYAALFGSMINLMIPYRIFNIYNRGAAGENLAMVFMPLVICGLYELYVCKVDSEQYRKAKVPLIIGLSGILQSHLLSCELTVIFMLAICAIFFKKTFRKETFLELVKAAIWCLLLNVWFWYPLLHMLSSDTYKLQTVISESIQDRGLWFGELFQVFLNMGSAQSGLYHTEPVHMGAPVLIMLFVALFVVLRRKLLKTADNTRNPYDNRVVFFGVLTVFCVLFSMRFIPWDLLNTVPGISLLVQALQFPTRLFIPATVFAAFFAMFFMLWLEAECKIMPFEEKVREMVQKGVLSAIMILSVGSALYHVNDISFEKLPVWLYNAENLGTQHAVNGEYLLAGTHDGEFSYHEPKTADEELYWYAYQKNGTDIEITVENTAAVEAYLELPLIGYKGYMVDAEEMMGVSPYITQERGDHGDLRIAIPSGYSGTLKIAYKGHWSYRVAEVISLVTILGLVIYAVVKRRKQWKAKR